MGFHVKYPLFLSNFLDRFLKKKKTQMSKFMKIRKVGAEMFHADGQTDSRDETNSRFSQFCESITKVIPS
jgi:hypothetical protein